MSMQDDIPGYTADTWVIDSARSTAVFEARLMGLATVRGNFTDFEGTIVTAKNPLDSSVDAVIRTTSVNTGVTRRDNHLRENDFFGVKQHPTIAFTSKKVRTEGDNFLVDGDLTIHSVTKEVTLNLEVGAVEFGAGGEQTAKFSARTELDRTDYGVTGGMSSPFIGKKVGVVLTIVAGKQN
ncbi:MAG: YceI family protein [Actinomycetota bacterium]|nr:YceI family protein [Actinomycetota bacterium]